MVDFSLSKTNFEKLLLDDKSKFSSKNEAETRIKIIDRIFLDCLNWDLDDLSVEESYNDTYTDYIFSAPNKALIVEAKKEGFFFELPEVGTKIKYSIKSLIKNNPELKKAVEQVSNYCKERGIPFAALFNGHQLIAFIGSRNDGIPPLEGDAFVFNSLESMNSHFTLLWNILSKEAVEDKKIVEKLINVEQKFSGTKLSNLVPYYPGNKTRNDLQAEFENLSGLIFEDIAMLEDYKAEFLKECYCSSGALSQYSMLSKQILENRYTDLFDECTNVPTIKPATTKKGLEPELVQNIYNKRPILLIGDVGAGKTAFIENLMFVEAPQLFEDSFTLYLNFGIGGALTSNLKEYICTEVSNQFNIKYDIAFEDKNFIKSVYSLDILKFEKGLYSEYKETNPAKYKEKEIEMLEKKIANSFQYLKDCILHVQKSRKKQLIIFLDNTDQRNEEVQQEVFLIACEIASAWNATVFLPMRPETFNRSNQLGYLSGYNTKAFTIFPPKTEQVIEKRIDYAIKISSGEKLIKKLGSSIQLSKLTDFLNVFKESFSNRHDLKDLIVNISGGNIRWALDYVRNFFGSGQIDTKKILNIYEKQGSYQIATHEFLKTIMYKNNEFYYSEDMPITNLFEVFSNDCREHFLTPLIIYYLYSNHQNKTEGGYVNSKILIENLQDEGFTPQQIEQHIKKCIKRKLIESSNKRIPEFMAETTIQLRETSIGLYHLFKLPENFTYIEGVSIDTALFDKSIYDKMKDYSLQSSSSVNIMDRLKRTIYFKEYLDTIWTNANFKTAYSWLSISEKLNAGMVRIRNKCLRLPEVEQTIEKANF